jgi:hypothetical protein
VERLSYEIVICEIEWLGQEIWCRSQVRDNH